MKFKFWKRERAHRVQIVDVQHREFAMVGVMGPSGPPLPHTIILLRCQCGCGSVETKTVMGEWSIEQLRGESTHDVVRQFVKGVTS